MRKKMLWEWAQGIACYAFKRQSASRHFNTAN
uniref:Uncharacterized protein n=1 Tax=Anguilla anguilla TaxID=7936 RepID=A0A0E9TK32_ANGAN